MSKIVSPVYMKRCTMCKLELPESDFAKNRSKPDGLNSECKSCCKERLAKYYQKNKASIQKKHKSYLDEHKDAIAKYQNVYQKQYEEQNKEELKKYRKEYYEKNKKGIDAKRRSAKAKRKIRMTTIKDMSEKELEQVYNLLSHINQDDLGSTNEEWNNHLKELEEIKQECIKRGLNI